MSLPLDITELNLRYDVLCLGVFDLGVRAYLGYLISLPDPSLISLLLCIPAGD